MYWTTRCSSLVTSVGSRTRSALQRHPDGHPGLIQTTPLLHQPLRPSVFVGLSLVARHHPLLCSSRRFLVPMPLFMHTCKTKTNQESYQLRGNRRGAGTRGPPNAAPSPAARSAPPLGGAGGHKAKTVCLRTAGSTQLVEERTTTNSWARALP